jgi:hypothetical protein
VRKKRLSTAEENAFAVLGIVVFRECGEEARAAFLQGPPKAYIGAAVYFPVNTFTKSIFNKEMTLGMALLSTSTREVSRSTAHVY